MIGGYGTCPKASILTWCRATEACGARENHKVLWKLR